MSAPAGPATVAYVRTPDRTERRWAANAAAVSALVGALTVAFSAGNRIPAAAVSAAAVGGYLVALRWRPPFGLLLAWTYGPPVAALLHHRGESVVFLLMVAVSYLVLLEDDRRRRFAAGVLAVAVPAAVQLVVRDDWGWPFWTGGLLVTWLSAEQMRRFRALVAELEATRERLAEQAVHLERRRIATELHDLVGHSLGVLLLHVTGARRRIADDPAGAEEALRRAESIGRAGLAEIRRWRRPRPRPTCRSWSRPRRRPAARPGWRSPASCPRSSRSSGWRSTGSCRSRWSTRPGTRPGRR
jgi:signal transduction histidine kinase